MSTMLMSMAVRMMLAARKIVMLHSKILQGRNSDMARYLLGCINRTQSRGEGFVWWY